MRNFSDLFTHPIYLLLVYLISINTIAFIAYGIDKFKAQREMRRISEFTLLLLAFFGGSVGALMGMNVWRHKTQHWKFSIGVPMFLLLQVALTIWFILARSNGA